MMVVTIVPCARKIEFTVVKDMTFVPFYVRARDNGDTYF